MNYNYSWLGLYQKGFKLQWRFKGEKNWNTTSLINVLPIPLIKEIQIRYKHSIQ